MAPFLDILIECELKQVISNSAVQQYAGMLPKYTATYLIFVDIYRNMGCTDYLRFGFLKFRRIVEREPADLGYL